MSLAEKKQDLLRIVEDADEKLTGLLIALANEYNNADSDFSEEDIIEFNKRREEYYKAPEEVSSVEEVVSKIRNRVQK